MKKEFDTISRKTFDSTEYRKAINDFDGKHCLACGKELLPLGERKPRPHSLSVLAKCCNKECKEKFLSKTLFNWQELRLKAIKRDHHTCQNCGYQAPHKFYSSGSHWQTEDGLAVHHVIPIKDGGEEFDLGNCITLCVDCHKVEHNGQANNRRKHKTLDNF